jgi:hypothetical protein
MTLRQLSAVMIAVAMLFAPVAMASGSAMAMPPTADHHAQAIDSGHCEEQPGPSKDSHSDEQPCCAAMCTGIAVAPAGPAEPLALAASPDRPSPSGLGHSFLAELPTPPPRLA